MDEPFTEMHKLSSRGGEPCLNPNLSSSSSRNAVTEMKMQPSQSGMAPPVRMEMAIAEPIVSWMSAPTIAISSRIHNTMRAPKGYLRAEQGPASLRGLGLEPMTPGDNGEERTESWPSRPDGPTFSHSVAPDLGQ